MFLWFLFVISFFRLTWWSISYSECQNFSVHDWKFDAAAGMVVDSEDGSWYVNDELITKRQNHTKSMFLEHGRHILESRLCPVLRISQNLLGIYDPIALTSDICFKHTIMFKLISVLECTVVCELFGNILVFCPRFSVGKMRVMKRRRHNTRNWTSVNPSSLVMPH